MSRLPSSRVISPLPPLLIKCLPPLTPATPCSPSKRTSMRRHWLSWASAWLRSSWKTVLTVSPARTPPCASLKPRAAPTWPYPRYRTWAIILLRIMLPRPAAPWVPPPMRPLATRCCPHLMMASSPSPTTATRSSSILWTVTATTRASPRPASNGTRRNTG